MRIKTGETATASLLLDVQYRCSACGRITLTTEVMKGTAQTATLMGINLDRSIEQKAVMDLERNIASAMNKENIERFRKAGFTCKCKHCGHTEPWAQLNYGQLDKFFSYAVSALIVSGIMAIIGLQVRPLNLIHAVVLVVTVLSAVACIAIRRHKVRHMEQMEQLTANLPEESLPTIMPYSQERHDEFRKGM